MQATIITEDNKHFWNQFLIENFGSFLQSFQWGEFQKSMSRKIWRVVIEESGKRLAQALIIKESFPLKIKNCFYLPFGPCFQNNLSNLQKQEVLKIFLEKISQIAKTENAIFLRIEPLEKLYFSKELLIKDLKKRTQPQKTLIIDLQRPEQEILKRFNSNTRYNIRLAQRKGVRVIIKDEYDPVFYELIRDTAQKKQFKPFSANHYEKLFQVSGKDFKVKMFLAEFEGRIISAYILVCFGRNAVFLHGANDWNYRHLKASNLLEWEKIKWAKSNNCFFCDLWGIDEKRWPGITAFKKGFNGSEHTYPLGIEIAFQPFWYRVYKILSKIL
jgi:peptidoglycan pentaglycine glycine transferase (the first glycine)